jgi:hypothetical protein
MTDNGNLISKKDLELKVGKMEALMKDFLSKEKNTEKVYMLNILYFFKHFINFTHNLFIRKVLMVRWSSLLRIVV